MRPSASHVAMEYALDLSRRSRATYVGEHPSATGVCKALGLPRIGWVLDARHLGCGLFELARRQTRMGQGWAQVPDWMHALVLASLVHPDPPAELLAHASIILATGYVEVVQ